MEKADTNKEGLTLCEWLDAVGLPPTLVRARPEYRTAWENGEDPTEWRAHEKMVKRGAAVQNPFKAMSDSFPVEAFWLARCFQVGHTVDQVYACARMFSVIKGYEIAPYLRGAHFGPWLDPCDSSIDEDSYKALNELASEFLDSLQTKVQP